MKASRRDVLIGLSSAAAVEACERTQEKPRIHVGASSPDRNATSVQSAAAPPVSSGARGKGSEPEPTSAIAKRPLGKTGESVSMIGLGGFHLGKAKDEAESTRLVRDAVEAGLNFLDNCWDYNDGDSEVRMGKALRDGYRQRVFLMTKLDGRTRKAATGQLEQSLRRLQTDVIDLVQVHEVIRDSDPRRAFEKDGVIAALIDARKAGKLRFIGFTGHKDPKIHLSMLRAADDHGFQFDTVQMPLNVLDAHFRSFEREVLPVLQAKQIGVLGMKSMADGSIVKAGVATPEECLRYALSLPTSVVICGMEKLEVLSQNLHIARNFKPLSADEREALLARTRTLALAGKTESFKTTHDHDGTVQHPHWLEEARI